MPPFMSQAPRPYSTPFCTSAPNGSCRQVAAPTGTTSVWPAKQKCGAAGADAGEQILDLADSAAGVTVKPSRSQRVGQHGLRAGVGRRDRGAADQRLRQRASGISAGSVTDQSRSNSLIEVLARVCASTA